VSFVESSTKGRAFHSTALLRCQQCLLVHAVAVRIYRDHINYLLLLASNRIEFRSRAQICQFHLICRLGCPASRWTMLQCLKMDGAMRCMTQRCVPISRALWSSHRDLPPIWHQAPESLWPPQDLHTCQCGLSLNVHELNFHACCSWTRWKLMNMEFHTRGSGCRWCLAQASSLQTLLTGQLDHAEVGCSYRAQATQPACHQMESLTKQRAADRCNRCSRYDMPVSCTRASEECQLVCTLALPATCPLLSGQPRMGAPMSA